ncbi:hypothetical protein, partial [Desulfosarcina sp.]|uniref:hypothetical protein n=1 Tax=Desulfosarcina sp. TaxID=2027861 RepID=UPI0039708FDF
ARIGFKPNSLSTGNRANRFAPKLGKLIRTHNIIANRRLRKIHSDIGGVFTFAPLGSIYANNQLERKSQRVFDSRITDEIV